MSKRLDADLRAESIEVLNPVPPAPTPAPTPFTRGEDRDSEGVIAVLSKAQADAPLGESAASPVSEGLLGEGRRSAELKASATTLRRSTCCPVCDPR